jgi:hypothetical protein
MAVLTDRDVLGLMLANDKEPILSADTISALLERAQVRDDYNRLPGEDDYVPTYNLNVAAARGWRMKAARVAADYDLDVDQKGLTRSQMIKQMLQMANEYARLGAPMTRAFGADARRRQNVPYGW